ncbi:MAG TPA: helix-turn-helix domain-containing protein [Stellaceae bacterium]|nr:helix-turn-helix domain-containing protein [Stellaceae bacterium]
MEKTSTKARDNAAAQRRQIIQRVLVDGWSLAQAAAAFGLDERLVARWLADYRRRGMASLRDDAASEGAVRRVVGSLRFVAARFFRRRDARQVEPNPCVELRRADDGRHGG